MQQSGSWVVAFALVYLTFFLDNVLLTVLVPIIPDWVAGPGSLASWGTLEAPAPLARVLNATVHDTHAGTGSGSAALVGAVLSAKALAQLGAAGPAGAAVCARGPAAVLRAGTALLLIAALVFAWCSWGCAGWGAARAGACAGAGRAAHGAGAALCGVAGLSLAQAATPPALTDRALGALLGAVALGVLVGYPFGGATYALWNREAPFVVIAAALLLTLCLQYKYLQAEEFNQVRPRGARGAGALAAAGEGACGACAGAVLLTTCVMAALEPCLPLWLMERFHPQKWVSGAVFVPDSIGYVVACSALGGGGAARRAGAEPLALAGQAALGLAALALPHASSVGWLAGPHVVLGAGLGAVDAALVPALLARRPAAAPRRAALLQAAASAAYVIGPVAGGVVSWCVGFPALMRALGVLNLLYAAHLYRALRKHPLSKQWGALSESESESDDEEGDVGELRPLRQPPVMQ